MHTLLLAVVIASSGCAALGPARRAGCEIRITHYPDADIWCRVAERCPGMRSTEICLSREQLEAEDM